MATKKKRPASKKKTVPKRALPKKKAPAKKRPAPKKKAASSPKKRRTKAPSQLRMVAFKVNPADYRTITAKAKRVAKGCVSAWLRAASTRYVPKKGEKISLKGYG